jgi:hypothetical protein
MAVLSILDNRFAESLGTLALLSLSRPGAQWGDLRWGILHTGPHTAACPETIKTLLISYIN